jgi:PAS domain S-box-containing protein
MASEMPPRSDKAAAGKRGRALLASERAVGLILENTSDLVALLDTNGVRLYNNPSYHALFGERDLTGTDSFREIHPDDRERVRELFRATVATGVGQRTRYRFLLEDGSIRHIESQGNVVRDADGKVAQVVVIARDVTEHNQSEQALQDAIRQLRATVHELEQRNRENALLGKVGDLLQMCKSVEESNGVLAHYVGKLFPGTCGSFYHVNPVNNLLEAVATWGTDEAADDPVISKEDCWALRSGRLHSVEGPGAGLACQHLSRPPVGPYFCAPITAQGEVLGMLHVRFAEGGAQHPALNASQPETRKFWVLAVSEHLSLALANLKLRETLRTQAVRDALTGLYNRRYGARAGARCPARGPQPPSRRANHAGPGSLQARQRRLRSRSRRPAAALRGRVPPGQRARRGHRLPLRRGGIRGDAARGHARDDANARGAALEGHSGTDGRRARRSAAPAHRLGRGSSLSRAWPQHGGIAARRGHGDVCGQAAGSRPRGGGAKALTGAARPTALRA